jgi:ADP-ribose pyrophosphatase YjhB (NUDIX family)
MISFDVANHRFTLRAAAIFLQDNSVLLHRLADDAIWALPGGRVEPGEDAASAVVREMLEEVAERVQCGELVFLVENFFEHQSQSQHEIGLYFFAHLEPESPLRVSSHSHFGVEGSKRLEFRWFPRSELSQVNLHPSFLRTALAKPRLLFEHVVHRQ